MSGPVLHIGYAKAASTFLQDVVFPKLVSRRYVPLSAPVTAWKDDLVHSPCDDAEAPARRRKRLEEIAGAPLSSGIVISYEGFSVTHAADGRTVADKLRDVFGRELNVLIVIREQRAWLRSMFLQVVKQGLFPLEGGLQGFMDSDYWDKPPASLYAPLRRIDYEALISSHVEAFGRERVKVLIYEQFAQDPPGFAASLKAALELTGEDIDEADFQAVRRVNQAQTVGGERARGSRARCWAAAIGRAPCGRSFPASSAARWPRAPAVRSRYRTRPPRWRGPNRRSATSTAA